MNRLHRRVAALFPTRDLPRTTRVGVEQELLAFDTRTGDAVDIERVRRAVEGTPLAGVHRVRARRSGRAQPALRAGSARARRMLRDRSLGAAASAAPTQGCGSSRRRSTRGRSTGSPLQLRSPRYLAMQEHFDRIGPAGRRMMRQTDEHAGVPGLVARTRRARAVAGAAARRPVPGGAAQPERRSRLAAGHLAGGRPGPHRLRRPAAPRRRPGGGVRRFRARRRTVRAGRPSTCRRCSRRCGPAGATSRCGSWTPSPTTWWGRSPALLADLLYDDERRRQVLALLAPEQDRLAEHWRTAAVNPDLVAGPRPRGAGRRRPAGWCGMTGALFVTDPLDGLDAGIDSSVGLMAATEEHDAEVWVCRARGPGAHHRPAGRAGAADHVAAAGVPR